MGPRLPAICPDPIPARSPCSPQAYLSRLRESLDIPSGLLSRWQAINAAARLAEGVPPEPLLEVWRRFAWAQGRAADAQAAAG